MRRCANCDAPFEPRRRDQIKCDRKCGRNRGHNKNNARTRRRAEAQIEFIGVDGEGITRSGGAHDYVLLSVGEHHLHNDGARLGFLEIAEFLYAQFDANPAAVFVGYYLGYDFAQWLRDLPANRAFMLLSNEGIDKRQRKLNRGHHLPPFPVDWGGWQFDTLALRRFRLRPAGLRSDFQGGGKPRYHKGHPWLTICDVGPFFQCSFLAAIDPARSLSPIVSQSEYDLIRRGKEGRGADEFNADMIRYNQLECEVLARLMAELNAGIVAEGIKLRRHQWIGPGQVAQKWLRKIEAPTGELIRETVPEEFRDAARRAYFGGWFEIFWHGNRPGPSYGYDINSAYPKIMAGLPCLLHGRYRRLDSVAEAAPGDYVLVRAELRGGHPFVGAALHRRPKGSVNRPRQTAGWYWLHELRASLDAGFIDRIDIAEALAYSPCDCPPPLAPIAELYEGRLRIGKNTPAGKTRKLIYNSGYGKFTQSVGEPVYGNAVYASLITAGCRTMIVEAISSHPYPASLLMVATDSVTFAEPHTALNLDGARLGAWSPSTHNNLSLFMPGVYWDDTTRERLASGDNPSLKSRGIASRDLSKRIAVIDRAWQRFNRDGWPRLILPVTFQLVSPRQALARRKWELCGAVISNGRRIISADPKLKRSASAPGFSRPYQRNEILASTPYDRHFGEELEGFNALEFGDHPEGPIGSVLLRGIWRD